MMNIEREIEQLRKHAAKMEADAEYFIQCRKRLERWTYSGDSAGDPAEDPQIVLALAGIDRVIARAKAAKRKAITEASELNTEWQQDALAGFGE